MRAWLLPGLAVVLLSLSAFGLLWLTKRAAKESSPEARILEALDTQPEQVRALVEDHPGVARKVVSDLWKDYLDSLVGGGKPETDLEKASMLSRAIERVFDDPSYLAATRRYETLSGAEAREKRQADRWIEEVESDYLERRIEQARRKAEKALEVYRAVGDVWGELLVVHLLGNIEWVSGEMKRAEIYYRTLVEQANGLGNREREAAALNNLAMIDERQGKLREAAMGYRRVWTLGEKHGIPRIVGFALLYQGNLYHRLGLHERAVEYLQRAEDTFERQNNLRMQGVAASNRGASLQLLEEYDQAVTAYQRSLELRSSERERASTLLHVAELNFEQGEPEQALEDLERILVLTRDKQEVESRRLRWGALLTAFDIHRSERRADSARRALEEAEVIVEDVGSALDRVETVRRRAQLSRDEGDVSRAVEDLETAVDIIESLRASPEMEEERIRFLAAQESVYQDLVEIHLRRLEQPLEAFRISELARSRAFLDSLQGGARLSADGMGRFAVVLPSSAEPVTAERIVSSLPSDGVLLHYTVAPRWMVVLAFDRRGLRSWAVKDVDESDLADSVRRFGRWVTDPAVEEQDDSGRRLTRLLLEPVRTVLTEHHDLVIVPDDILFGIPWAALPLGGRYLVEGRKLVVEPSASVFVRLTERARRSGDTTALLVANPTIELKAPDESHTPRLETVDSTHVRPLPEAEVEAVEIAGLLPSSEVLLGEEADETEVRSSMGRHGVIHFGTHVWIVNDHPLSSCLLLAGGAKAVEEARLAPVAPSDGVLTGYEALGIGLKPGAMVTLAACQSVGRNSGRGEGVVGLARAFFEAGAGTVVGSLWAVEDRATRELMVRFYREIYGGSGSTSEALSRAQAAVAGGAAGERRRHPFYWAGFILIGDGR